MTITDFNTLYENVNTRNNKAVFFQPNEGIKQRLVNITRRSPQVFDFEYHSGTRELAIHISEIHNEQFIYVDITSGQSDDGTFIEKCGCTEANKLDNIHHCAIKQGDICAVIESIDHETKILLANEILELVLYSEDYKRATLETELDSDCLGTIANSAIECLPTDVYAILERLDIMSNESNKLKKLAELNDSDFVLSCEKW